jgi:hypothetical protein
VWLCVCVYLLCVCVLCVNGGELGVRIGRQEGNAGIRSYNGSHEMEERTLG